MRKQIRQGTSSSNMWLPGFEPEAFVTKTEEAPSFDKPAYLRTAAVFQQIPEDEPAPVPSPSPTAANSSMAPSTGLVECTPPLSATSALASSEESDPAPSSIEAMQPAAVKVTPPPVVRALKKRVNLNHELPHDYAYASTVVERFDSNILALETLAVIESEGRAATPDEKSILARYSGWGGLSEAFGGTNKAWDARREQVKAALPGEAYEAARASVLNAHYTDPAIIRWMYKIVARLGFEGGRTLDPCTGIGHFVGAMPKEMADQSDQTAVELDPTSARIAQALYPSTTVINSGLEKADLPDGHFDLVMSNVPFGDYTVFDQALKSKNVLIHDYFFLKAARLVRPGGLIAFITSVGTLDKDGAYTRTVLQQSCDLVGAVRLPATAFAGIASTEVPTDVIFLRRRLPGEAASNVDWINTDMVQVQGAYIRLNKYFGPRRDRIIGSLGTAIRGQHRQTTVSFSGNLLNALELQTDQFPVSLYAAPTTEQSISPRSVVRLETSAKVNSFTVSGGEIMRVGQDGRTLEPVAKIGTKVGNRIAGMVAVRDSMREVLRTQVENESDEAIATAIRKLNQSYDFFVAHNGILHDKQNRRAFKGDPDLPSLLALEDYDDEAGTAAKMAIFTRRTIMPVSAPTVASTPEEAYTISLSWKGGVDPEFICQLYTGMNWDEISTVLMDKGLAWMNPETQKWEPREIYLAGNVRKKLRAARFAAGKDSYFEKHVAALEAIIPEDLQPHEIDAGLGAAWIPDDVVQKFVCELLDATDVTVKHSLQAASWKVSFGYSVSHLVHQSVQNTKTWGTSRVPAIDLINDALNQVTTTVYDKRDEKQVVNEKETMLAREKLAEVRQQFREWAWKDDARAVRLARIYNDEFNSTVLPEYSGAHLTFPWLSDAIKPREYQANAVWRYLCGGNLLLAHCVGAGKTATAIIAHMEARRIGLIKKPLFVVPNHMLEQYAAEFLRLYPAANLLCASKEDLAGDSRRELLARIATGEWDGVIITHSSFEKLSLDPSFIADFIDEEMARLDAAIAEAWAEDRTMAKRLEGVRKAVASKLERLSAAAAKDKNISFDELGVDALVVDESQAFKNLFYVTRISRVAGLPNSVSRRALDMYAKVQYVQSKHNGDRGVMFTTATPIANSMAEMFTQQRYLSRKLLREHELDSFDAWAATFGRVVSSMEVSPDGGGFRMNNRFAQFVNLPELMRLFGSIADVKTREEIKLPVPQIQDGKPQVIKTVPSAEIKAVVEKLVKRAEKIRSGGVKPHEDNMLAVTGDGRRVALDLRLYDPMAQDDPNSKVNSAVRNVFRIWDETKAERKTQLVFCDLSTPKKVGFSVYNDMQTKLVRLGVPEEEIAFIHDYDTDEKKASLFRRVRKGIVRILIGSTAKMGVGTNVQRLLCALHHLDVPWRPDEVEQRDGRGLRPGNLNKEIAIYRYVTESTFDAYMWQTLEVKASFVAQVMSPNCKVRTAEDVVVAALTFAEVKAVATGNPLFLRKAAVDSDIAKLTLKQRDWERQRWDSKRSIEWLPERIEQSEKVLASALHDDQMRIAAESRTDFSMELNGTVISEPKRASEVLEQVWQNAAKMEWKKRETHKVGTYCGFEIAIHVGGLGEPHYELVGELSHEVNNAIAWTVAITNAIKRIPGYVTECETRVSLLRKQLADLKASVALPFPGSDELERLYVEQDQIYRELGLVSDQSYGADGAETEEKVCDEQAEPEVCTA